MMVAAPAIVIRAAQPSDQAYVSATLADQLQRASQGSYDTVNDVVNRIFDSPRTRVAIAEEGRRIVGWLAYAAIPKVRALLFVYVRREERNRGIARRLAHAVWAKSTGAYVHPGLRGRKVPLLRDGVAVLDGRGTALDLIDALKQRHSAIEMKLEEML